MSGHGDAPSSGPTGEDEIDTWLEERAAARGAS
jgi:hypothetical protein